MTTPDPHHASELCGPEPGRALPVIDRNRCEGKAECVRVCPHDVFTITDVSAEDRRAMSVLGRLKLKAHGGRQAYALNGADCHACGLCVTACPEDAISLRPAHRGSG